MIAVDKEKAKTTRKWIIDSGTSAHMCNDAKAFRCLKDDPAKSKRYIENEYYLPLRGIGTVNFITVVEDKQLNIELKDELRVPDISCNLISMNRFRKSCVKMTFDSDKNGR